jgi:hypothetical protein
MASGRVRAADTGWTFRQVRVSLRSVKRKPSKLPSMIYR